MSERQAKTGSEGGVADAAPYGTVVYAGPVSRRFRSDMPLDGGHDYGVELAAGPSPEPEADAAAEARPVTAPTPFGGGPDAVASSFVAAQGIARQHAGAEVHVSMGFEAEQPRSSHQL
jgi:hypothetical protein